MIIYDLNLKLNQSERTFLRTENGFQTVFWNMVWKTLKEKIGSVQVKSTLRYTWLISASYSRLLSSVSGHFIHVQSWSKRTCVHTYLQRGLYHYIYYNFHVLDDGILNWIREKFYSKGYMMNCIGGLHMFQKVTAILEKWYSNQNWSDRISCCILNRFSNWCLPDGAHERVLVFISKTCLRSQSSLFRHWDLEGIAA